MTLRIATEQFVTADQVRARKCGCISANSPTDAVINLLIDAASDVIAIVSDRAISGRQTVKGRPCRIGYEHYCCPCCGADVIPLGDTDPTDLVVKIDGVQLTDTEIWQHRNNLGVVIARLSADGTQLRSWPSSQRRWLPDTEDHTFSVQWEQGVHIDQHIIQAAALEVVCDFASDDSLMAHLIDGVSSMELGDASVTIDPNRLAEAGDTRLNRIANGELGPMTRRMIGILHPQGRATSSVWAPELRQGWEMNLELVP